MIVLQICYNYYVARRLTFTTHDERLILKNTNQFKKKLMFYSCHNIIKKKNFNQSKYDLYNTNKNNI